MRSFKIFNILLIGLEIVISVKQMIYKMILCVPIVMKLLTIIFVIIYIYSSIGVEIFSSNKNIVNPYSSDQC